MYRTFQGIDLLRAGVYAFFLFCVCVVLFTFTDYGVTADEPGHVEYGDAVYRWYRSGFRDREVFGSNNTWLYGGLFDLSTHFFSRLLPLDVYDTRHLFNALVGLLGAAAAYRLGCLIGGRSAGLLAALFLLLTPRYYGHAFNNPKDIPFAVGYLWGVYTILRGTQCLPDLPREFVWKTGLAIGCTMAIRANGAVLLGYLGLFYGFAYCLKKEIDLLERGRRFVLQTGAIVLIACAVMLLFWPWAQLHPFTAVWEAARTFAAFPEIHTSFFEGRYVASDEIPWYYTFKWLLITLPEFLLLGLVLILFGLIQELFRGRGRPLQRREEGWLGGFFFRIQLGFTAFFPLAYAALARTPLYDGMRHMLFVLPPLAVLSALGVADTLRRFRRPLHRRALLATLGLLVGLALGDMVRLHPFQSVYFNRLIAGGLENASGRYETDYWQQSYKQGVEWLRRQPADGPLRIAADGPAIHPLLESNRLVYADSPEDADFYVGTTRYDRHRVVPGDVVHVVRAAGVPLLYVIRPDSARANDPFFADSPFRHLYLAEQARDQEAAVASYRRALEHIPEAQHPSRQVGMIHVHIGNLYFEMGQYDGAATHYRKAVDLMPHHVGIHSVVYNNVGLIYVNLGRYSAAIEWFQKAIAAEPRYVRAYDNLAGAYMVLDQKENALRAYRRAAELEPEATEIHYKIGKLTHVMNRPGEAAESYRQIIALDPDDVLAHYNLGLVLASRNAFDEALDALERAVALDPDQYNAHVSIGAVCLSQADYARAATAYRNAIRVRPEDADAHAGLGVALAEQGRRAEAEQMFRKALGFDPNHDSARRNLEYLADSTR